MTTSNSIIIQSLNDVLFIPLEAVHTNDSLSFVYRKNGSKQIVVLDESNENEIIVEAGLDENDKILLSIPEDAEDQKYVGLELVEVIRKKEEEKRKREEELQAEREKQNERMKMRRIPVERPEGWSEGRSEERSQDSEAGSTAREERTGS